MLKNYIYQNKKLKKRSKKNNKNIIKILKYKGKDQRQGQIKNNKVVKKINNKY